MYFNYFQLTKVFRPLEDSAVWVDIGPLKLLQHEGVNVRGPNGEVLVWRGVIAGEYRVIVDPIIHFTHDSTQPKIVSPREFRGTKPKISYDAKVYNISGEQLRCRCDSIFRDKRPFELFKRDCSTTANSLLKNTHFNSQLGMFLGVLLVGTTIYYSCKE